MGRLLFITALMDYTPVALTIYQMVLNRLPFLADSVPNQTLVGSFIYESMVELDVCFKIDTTNPLYDASDPTAQPTYLGDEQYYSPLQKLIIADLTAYTVILYIMVANTAGTASGSSNGTQTTTAKYMSRSKAGSAEVEWKGFEANGKVAFFTNGSDMAATYKASAFRRALSLGCNIDITSAVGFELWKENTPFVPFKVVTDNCGCTGYSAIERGGLSIL